MTHFKNYFNNYKTVSILFIGLFFIIVSAFKSVNEEKKLMTIEVIESGRGKGIYVYVDGKNIEYVEVPTIGYDKAEIIANGTILSQTLHKYYKENWRLVGSSNGSVVLNTTFTGTRIYLEK